MTEEIIIDKEDKEKKHRNNEIDCLHFYYRKGESGNVLFWCDFYDDHCDNYTGCYYRKYLRLEQENKELKTCIEMIENTEGQAHIEGVRLAKENKNYRSALEEIKSIIVNNNSMLIDKKDYLELRCGEPIAFKLQKIYNKINEVLNS